MVLNVAVTLWAALIETMHAPEPLHAPPHPAKLEPTAGAGVSVTLEPEVKLAVHVAPQLMPAGVLETSPVPVPALVTDSAKAGSAAGLYVTLIVALPPTVTVALCETAFGV